LCNALLCTELPTPLASHYACPRNDGFSVSQSVFRKSTPQEAKGEPWPGSRTGMLLSIVTSASLVLFLSPSVLSQSCPCCCPFSLVLNACSQIRSVPYSPSICLLYIACLVHARFNVIDRDVSGDTIRRLIRGIHNSGVYGGGEGHFPKTLFGFGKPKIPIDTEET